MVIAESKELYTSIRELRAKAPRVFFEGTITAAAEAVVPNFGTVPAGQIAAIGELLVQTGDDTAVTVTLADGSGGTTLRNIRCPRDGSGVPFHLTDGNEIRLSTATSLYARLSTAGTVYISGSYYLEDSTTGVPV